MRPTRRPGCDPVLAGGDTEERRARIARYYLWFAIAVALLCGWLGQSLLAMLIGAAVGTVGPPLWLVACAFSEERTNHRQSAQRLRA